MTDGDAVPLGERRGQTDRRRYNRRSAPDTASPPYYEVFERIAIALESIDQSLRSAEEAPSRPRSAPRNRRS